MVLRCSLRVGSVTLLGAFLLGVSGDVAVAARESISVQSSSWRTTGFTKLKGIPGAPTTPLVSEAIVGFGDLPGPGLPGDFGLVLIFLEEDLTIEGTYAEPTPGKPVFFIDLVALDAQFDTPPFLIEAATLKAKTRSRFGIDLLDAKFSIKLKVCPTDGAPDAKCKNGKVSYKGSGGRA